MTTHPDFKTWLLLSLSLSLFSLSRITPLKSYATAKADSIAKPCSSKCAMPLADKHPVITLAGEVPTAFPTLWMT